MRSSAIVPVIDRVVTPRALLTAAERHAMRSLLARHFVGIETAQFERDLSNKDWVLRLFSGDRLVGFTTLAVCERRLPAGFVATVVYSGDTIVEPEAWHSPALSQGWIRLVRAAAGDSGRPCYWLLLSSGFRTYRFLPVFWREFWPRYDRQTPPDVEALMRDLAVARYGDAYLADRGIVRFNAPQRLSPALAELPPGRQSNPHIAHFQRLNPGHASGDELVCLTELSPANLTAAGRRVAGE